MADNEIVMMNIETGHYHSINEVGSQIWQMLESPKTVAEICEQLVTDYEVDASTCEQEVTHFIEHLANEGLLSK